MRDLVNNILQEMQRRFAIAAHAKQRHCQLRSDLHCSTEVWLLSHDAGWSRFRYKKNGKKEIGTILLKTTFSLDPKSFKVSPNTKGKFLNCLKLNYYSQTMIRTGLHLELDSQQAFRNKLGFN